MFEFVVLEKEIYLFGKKEKHAVLCVRWKSVEGYDIERPLTYAMKGKDDQYYQHYVIMDNMKLNTNLVLEK